jgi:ribosomal protein L25 (general stress protein Ctc)
VSDNKLVAETRTQFGKGAARKIRRDHKIPAVMYGHGAEPVHITLPGHDTMMALKVANALLTIVIDGDEQLALAELVVVAAAFAYVLGIVGARLLGSTLASFVGLTEVLFAVLFAWLLLAELPGVLQLVGGAVLLSGVVAVRLGERDLARSAGARKAAAETDLDVPSHVA